MIYLYTVIVNFMKNKKKLILTVILSLVAVVILVGVYLKINSKYTSNTDGQIQVELVNLDKTIIKEKTIDFNEGDTLKELLEDNFNNVVFENGMLMAIEDYITPSDWSTFISVYVDDEMSMVGLLDIQFKNGTKISLVITEYIYS